MAGIREAAGEDAVVEGFRDVTRDEDATDGNVTRVDSLSEGNEIGDDVECVERKPFTGATEAGHDFVEDQNDAVLVGESSNSLEVTGRWGEDSGGSGHCFHEERRNRFRPLGLDDPLEVVKGALRLLLRRGRPVFGSVEVGPKDVNVSARILVGDSAPVTRRDDRRTRVAVVRAVERDDLVAAGVNPRHTNGVFDGVGTAVGEEHLFELLRRVGENLLGRERAHVVRVGRGNRREDVGLRVNCLNDLRVLMPDVDVDEHAREIQVSVAVVIPHFAALAARNNERRKSGLG